MQNSTARLVRQHPVLERIALAAPEQRAELGVPRALLAQLAHVSPESVRKLEHGGMLGPELLLRVAVVLHTLSMYAPVTPLEDEVVARLLQPGRRLLATLNGDAA